jgi:hypothetical protein
MGYVSRTLVRGERVIAQTCVHWIIFGVPLFGCAAAAALLLIGLCAGGYRPVADVVARAVREGEKWNGQEVVDAHSQLEWLGTLVAVAGGVLIGAALLAMLKAVIRRHASEFAVTDRRVLLKQGLFGSKSLEILLAKVESIYVEQGLLGRILDYGSLVVIGTGGTQDVYGEMASPMAFRRAIQEQIGAVAK